MDHFPMFLVPILWVFFDSNTNTLTKNPRPKPIPISWTRHVRYQYPTNMICFFETIPILHITIRRYQYNTNTMTSSGFNTNTNTNTSETLFAIPRPIPIPLTYFFQYQYRYDTESIEKFRFQYRNCADTDQYRTALISTPIPISCSVMVLLHSPALVSC